MFNFVFSQISGDKNKHAALICDKSSKRLKKAYELRRLTRDAEISHFSKTRAKLESTKGSEPVPDVKNKPEKARTRSKAIDDGGVKRDDEAPAFDEYSNLSEGAVKNGRRSDVDEAEF